MRPSRRRGDSFTASSSPHAVTGRPGGVSRAHEPRNEPRHRDDPPRLYPAARSIPRPCVKEDARRAAEMLAGAECPVMIAGRGVHASKAYDELRALAELFATTGYMGKMRSPKHDWHSAPWRCQAGRGQRNISKADCILAVGTGSPENTRMLAPGFIDPGDSALSISTSRRSTRADIRPRWPSRRTRRRRLRQFLV